MPEADQVRVYRDEKGIRSSYDDFEVGEDLGTATLFIKQDEIEAECLRRGYYHPWYSVDSPFGGTIVPAEMSYHAVRPLFSRRYYIVGLLYKWSFEFFAPVLANVAYEFNARLSDKWIKNEREFVAYDAICRDESGAEIFTTRRVHVLDFLKRTAPRVAGRDTPPEASDGVRPEDRHLDVPGAQSLDAMAKAAAAARSVDQTPPGDVTSAVRDISPLAGRDTPLGASLPITAMSYSKERFDHDWLGHGRALRKPNRNYDPNAARREGLPAPVAPGTWIMGLIFQSAMQFFGRGWVEGGRADLTMRRPVFPGDFVTARGFVRSQELLADGSVRVACEVWVENQEGEKKVVGTISGIVH